MYETEANHTIESSSQIPAEVVSALAELKGKILARTVLPWSEHCTECFGPPATRLVICTVRGKMADAEDLPMAWSE